MAERSSRKIPVTERQFLWVQDDDKGEVILHVGPTMVSPTAADRVVIGDSRGGFREDPSGKPQGMIEVSDAQYAVLYNPMQNREEGPNGTFRSGRNESRALRNGTRSMIPGPCSFYLRPGQRCEVRDAHELASNQYLVVKVYGEVDNTAPYYEITARSAAITSATAEESDGVSTALPEIDVSENNMTRGQLIVIRGLDTQFYIPPTGVDIVPDLSVDDRGTTLTSAAVRRILDDTPLPDGNLQQDTEFDPDDADQAMLFDELGALELNDEGPAAERSNQNNRREAARKAPRKAAVQQAARLRQVVQRQAAPQAPAPLEARSLTLTPSERQLLISSPMHRRALEREMRKGRLVRQAVVLGEKEFCVILDADGKRQIKVGPARVFPGPYDTFMTEGSDARIYQAYELLPQRALWLRFIAPISREKLARRLPRSVEMDAEQYHPGDEMILTGVNSFFFPINEIEILHPLTGQPHVGNDHSDVFIEAIGIDQKSGIYVRDLTTGEARLVRGKRSYLVDPRKEVHITRTVPPSQWNNWVAVNEAHKQTQRPVVTPWALSITVPPNTAVMAASANGQRVIEGPRVELLEYEETLVELTLSTGTPKSDQKHLRTAYLRTVGNRVSDVIRVITSDFVEMDIQVSYRVNFHPEHREAWFNHENYVGVLCDHLRSLVRSHSRQMTLMELWPDLPSRLRDLILGERAESGRPGRLIEENGMLVTEVEVLANRILDQEIASLLEKVQRDSVALQIGDRQETEKLRSEQLHHDLTRQRLEMQREAQELRQRTEAVLHKLAHEARLNQVAFEDTESQRRVQAQRAVDTQRQELKIALESNAAQAKAERMRVEAAANVDAERLRHEAALEHKRALHALEIALIEARSRADVAQREAIQPALVEALTAAGDKVLLGAVAENMNLVSLFKGKDIATLFAEVLGEASVARTVKTMMPPEGE